MGRDVLVLCWPRSSPAFPLGTSTLGWQRDDAVLLPHLLPPASCSRRGWGVPARSGALARMQPRSAVECRSSTGFNLLLHAPPPDLLPLLLGGSPGSDLTVTTTFMSCRLGKGCEGKHFLHPLCVTHQGNCWPSVPTFGSWCMQHPQLCVLSLPYSAFKTGGEDVQL